jgi:hypothetical protein
MPPNKVGLSEVRKMYGLIPDRSNLKQILQSNPQNLFLIRLGMGFSLYKFSSMVGTSYVNISEIERGKRKSISKPLMERILHTAKPLASLENIEESYIRITSLSHGGQTQAVKRAEKAEFTESERMLMEKLEEIGVKFYPHKTIATSIGPVNVDFLVKTRTGDIVIEITKSTRRQKLESMSYRAMKLKNTLSDTLLVAILPDRITNALERRLEDFDIVLKFSDIRSLEKMLQLAPQAAV